MSESELKKIQNLKAELTRLQGCLADRNRQLDAMHWAWCSGGCASGMHRWSEVELTEELVRTAEYGVSRMRTWFENAEFKITWAKMTSEEREAWMSERVPAKALEENTSLKLKVEHALICIKLADDRLFGSKNQADVHYFRQISGQRKYLNEVEERYKESAFEVSCNAGVPPLQHNGQMMWPDRFNVSVEGYRLSWVNNEGIVSEYLATWSDVQNHDSFLKI